MANTKITELTAVTALAGTDVFPVVDVSASTTNKVSVEDLLRNAPDGSAGAPSIANAGDQDTGIFFPADNSVGVSTDGTQRLVIDSSGRVGIGTSPGANLHVSSTGDTIARVTSADGNGAFLDLGDASDPDGGRIVYDSGSNLTFSTASTERLRLTASGRCGIGTSVPADKLHVVGNGQFNDGTNGVIQLGSSSNNRIAGGSSYGGVRYYTNSGHAWYDSSSELMKIDSSGRLLVGQTSTSAVSTLLLENNSLGTSRQGILLLARGEATPDNGDALGTFVFTAGNHSPAVEINARRDGGTWTAGSSQPTRLEFSTTTDGASSPTERMRITSTGQMRLAGAGITFNGDTAAANELDDYEEGTFTPEFAGATTAGTYTYGSRTGHYTKIGDMVNVTIMLTNINTSTAGTGNINITGLPFTSANNSSFACGSVILDQFDVGSTTRSLAVRNNANTAILAIHQTRDSLTDSPMSVDDKVTNGADIVCTITYRV